MAKSRAQLPHLHYPADMQQTRIINAHAFGGGGGPAFGTASRNFSSGNTVLFSSSSALEPLHNLSFGFWLKATGTPAAWDNIFHYRCGNNQLNNGFGAYWASSTAINLFTRVYTLGTVAVITPANWNHVMLTVSHSDPDNTYGPFRTLRLWINGVNVKTFHLGSPWTENTFGTGTNGLKAGVAMRISDLRIHDVQLTGAEIATIMTGTNVSRGLQGWWPFQEDNVLDYSGNGNNATNTGSTYSTDGPLD